MKRRPDKPIPSPLVAPLGDNARLVSLVADVTRQPAHVVRRRLYREELHIGSAVADEMRRRRLRPNVWSDRLAEFYGETDAFLYETIVWNRSRMKLRMREWIGAYLAEDAAASRPLEILAFGDGPGFDSLYLAECGHSVTYFEVSECSARFAQAIQGPAHRVRMVRDPREIERGAFDAALCLDVLEHVPDPGDIVEQLAGCLRPRGRLIVSAPFYLVSHRWATHLESNRRYSGNARLYTRRGLTLIDGRLGWDPVVFARRPFGETVRRASAAKRFALRVSGLAMVSACVWSAPVNWFVDAVWRNNRRWLEGLEP